MPDPEFQKTLRGPTLSVEMIPDQENRAAWFRQEDLNSGGANAQEEKDLPAY